jgi:hypothetical protein
MSAGSVRRPGRYWVFTAAVIPLNPLAWYFIQRWQACAAANPGAEQLGLKTARCFIIDYLISSANISR